MSDTCLGAERDARSEARAAEDGGGFFLDCPRALVRTLLERLNLYKLRAKVAIEDFSALLWLKGRVTPDLCQPLDLIADPDDPRDLWGMLMRAGPTFRAASAGALPPHPRDT